MVDFDYQWANIPDEQIEYNDERINEFLKFTKLDPKKYIFGKYCLDAGCGNGRYTHAMMKLGAKKVVSYDISEEAVKKCKRINENCFKKDLMKLEPNPIYDFVLSWGVLHHTPNPRKAFKHVASQVKEGGIFHTMFYHIDTQKQYEEGRKIWKTLSHDDKIRYCEEKIKSEGGTLHGWWDAFNPTYNFGYNENEIKKWFEEEGFHEIKIITKKHINIRGIK